MQSQDNLAAMVAKVWYSDSVEEWDTVFCFLTNQEMGFGPRKTSRPIVERLLEGSPAQFASEKAVIDKGPGVKEIPKDKVPWCNEEPVWQFQDE